MWDAWDTARLDTPPLAQISNKVWMHAFHAKSLQTAAIPNTGLSYNGILYYVRILDMAHCLDKSDTALKLADIYWEQCGVPWRLGLRLRQISLADMSLHLKSWRMACSYLIVIYLLCHQFTLSSMCREDILQRNDAFIAPTAPLEFTPLDRDAWNNK